RREPHRVYLVGGRVAARGRGTEHGGQSDRARADRALPPDAVHGAYRSSRRAFSRTSIESGRPFTKSTRVSPSPVCRTTPGIESALRYHPRGRTTELRGRPSDRSNTSSPPSRR